MRLCICADPENCREIPENVTCKRMVMQHTWAITMAFCTKCGKSQEEVEDGPAAGTICAGGPNTPMQMVNLVRMFEAGEKVSGVTKA